MKRNRIFLPLLLLFALVGCSAMAVPSSSASAADPAAFFLRDIVRKHRPRERTQRLLLPQKAPLRPTAPHRRPGVPG